MLAAALAVSAIAAFSSCGGESGAAQGTASHCEQQTREYLDTLRALALKILYIEGAYVEYRERVATIRAAREAIAADALSRDCRQRVVAVADDASDAYASALAEWDEWRACEKSRGTCNRLDLDRALQRHWQRADYTRQRAEQNLYDLLEAEERARGYRPTTAASDES